MPAVITYTPSQLQLSPNETVTVNWTSDTSLLLVLPVSADENVATASPIANHQTYGSFTVTGVADGTTTITIDGYEFLPVTVGVVEDESYLNKRGLTHFWENIDDLKLDTNGTAYRTSAIPYGECDNTSTSTAFTATVPGITELRDGVCMLLKNGVVTSASGFTIDINGLGAKPSYSNMAAATADTTLFNVNYTMLFIYDSTRVAGGCWICYRGYNSDTNTIAYQIRTNSTAMTTTDRTRYYRLLFTSADGTQWVPANTQYDNSATSNKTVNQRKINPFGRIVYMTGTTNVPAGSAVGATTTWDQYTLNLGYSFAKGSALTMTYPKPVYVKCAPQSDGSAIIDSTTPWVQDLPTTEDGKIYIFLGIAYSATNIELQFDHPVYEYKNGMIRPYVNADIPTKTSDLVNDGSSGTSTYVEADELSPQVSGVGDTMTLDNTSDCTSLDASTLYGNTTQTTYTGKNLIPLTDVNMSDSGSRQNDFNTVVPAGTYTVSFNLDSFVLGANASFGINLRLAGQGSTSVADKTIITIDSSTTLGYKTYTFSTTSPSVINVSYPSNVRIGATYWNNGARAVISNMQLEAGSTDTAFEPYVGGIPSPNPDYPQDVYTVTGKQTVSIVNRNLIDTTNLSSNTSGGIITTWSGNIGTSSGTTSSTSALATASTNFATPLPAGSYTFSVQSASTHTIVIALYNPSTSSWVNTTMSAGTKTILVTTNFVATRWRIGYSGLTTNTSFSDTITQPMLEYGSAASDDYEPYQAQSYEINLGKNLWGDLASSFSFDSGGLNGYLNTAYGTTRVPAGTTTATSYSCDLATATSNNYFITLKAGSYVVSGGTSDITLQVLDKDGTSLGTSFTITADTKVFIRTRISSGVTVSSTLIEPQIEAGDVATSYSEYFTPIELCKIGDYQDYIWNDNGTWKIRKNVGKITFTGSEDEAWGVNNTGTANFFYRYREIADYAGTQDSNILAFNNMASAAVVSSSNTDQGFMILTPSSTYQDLRVRYGTEMTVSNWKTFLSNNNMIIYYASDAPTDTIITDTTLVAQLDALYNSATGYNGQTNIFVLTPSPNLPGSLDVVAYPDSAISVATNKRAGIVKIGNGLNIDECGTLSLPETVYVTIEYGNSFNITSSGTGPLIVDNVTEQRSFCPFVVTPGTYTLYNENTNANITIDELFDLLESGKKVVLNNVCIGVSRYDDNGNITIDFNGFSSNIELSVIREITYEGDVTAHNTVYSGSAYSFDSAAAWSSVLGVAISKTVVVGDEGNPTYNLVIDGVKGYRK